MISDKLRTYVSLCYDWQPLKKEEVLFQLYNDRYQNSNHIRNKYIWIVKVYIVNRSRKSKARRQVADNKNNIKLMDENILLVGIISVNRNSSPVYTIMTNDDSFKTYSTVVLRYLSNTAIKTISRGSHRSKIRTPITVHNRLAGKPVSEKENLQY